MKLALFADAWLLSMAEQHTSSVCLYLVVWWWRLTANGSSHCALLTVGIAIGILSTPVAPIWLRDHGPGGPETDFAQEDIFGSKVKGFGNDE